MPFVFPSIVNKNKAAVFNQINDKTTNVHQKLNMMETAIAHLMDNKCRLISSAEKTKFGIRCATDQHISMLRERELKLFKEVDHELQHERQRLEEQIGNLNQTFGTLKFLMEKMPAFVDEMNLDELISTELEQKICALVKMANSSECANIVFNPAIPESFCHQGALLGQISVEFVDGPLSQHFPKSIQKTEDPSAFWLASQRLPPRNRSSNSTCSSEGTAQVEDHLPNTGETIRDRLASTSLSVASFDVISAGGALNGGGGVAEHFGTTTPLTVFAQQQQQSQQQQPNNSFAAYFNELNCLPIDHWLKPSSAADAPKKAVPSGIFSMQNSQPPITTPNNIAEMFSKIRMDPNEKQHKNQLLPMSKPSIGCAAKNHKKPPFRKRSVADGTDGQLGDQPNGTGNWAKADLSVWLKASKNVPSPTDFFGAVINSVMASPSDQWLLTAAVSKDSSNSKMSFSSAALDIVPKPPEAKIARHQTQETVPFAMGKYGQQIMDTNKSNQLSTLAESEELNEALDKLSKLFERNTFGGQVEHFEHPTNGFKNFSFSSAKNENGVDCCDSAVPKIVDREEHSLSASLATVPPPPPGDCTTEEPPVSKAMKFPLALPTDPSHWLKRYPPPKQNRPMNEMAEDLYCWESVLGWKSILEKIHGSGEDGWLAPSSRAIKNGGPAQRIEE